MNMIKPEKNNIGVIGKSVFLSVWRYVNEPEFRSYLTPLFGTIALFILGPIVVPGFTTVDSVFNYMALASLLMFACIAQTLVIISGSAGIDLSIGALMSLGAAWGGAMSGGSELGVLWAVLCMGAIGAICGLVSGMSVKYLSVPAMVVTLSIGNLVSGGFMAVTKGQPAGTPSILFKEIGAGYLFGHIRWVLVIAIVLVIIVELVLRKTKYGKSLYLVGTNERAATLSGIKTTRTVVLTYVIAGIASALAGVMLFAVVGATQYGMGDLYTMLSIAAVVIGGTSIAGGKGTFLGAVLSAIMLTVLTSVLTVIQIPQGARNCIQGLILLFILLVYARMPKLRQ